MDGLKQYFDGETELIRQLDLRRVERIIEALELVRNTGRRVFVFGNGGSATTASHLACDLGKGTVQPNLPRFQVVCLSDSVSLITAYANDMGCESMFAEPLISLAQGSDLAIALSVSGNSPNVLRATEAARERGLVTIGLTGYDGGRVATLVDIHLNIPSTSYGQVEDLHLAVCHAVCEMLKIAHD
jgi:D-sedoheptulose 7-phosphate isomerase